MPPLVTANGRIAVALLVNTVAAVLLRPRGTNVSARERCAFGVTRSSGGFVLPCAPLSTTPPALATLGEGARG